jgi:AcrR family transcriptional regulator
VEHYAGIDVSLELSSVCVVDGRGKIVKEAKVASEPQALVCFFKELVPPRERILAVATDLFNRHGIRAVGVESIADVAGTNKMTLYRHFASKDELVVEYLRRLADKASSWWNQLAGQHLGDPRGQLRAWLEDMADHVESCDERGRPLTNAAVELAEKDHPARRVKMI